MLQDKICACIYIPWYIGVSVKLHIHIFNFHIRHCLMKKNTMNHLTRHQMTLEGMISLRMMKVRDHPLHTQ